MWQQLYLRENLGLSLFRSCVIEVVGWIRLKLVLNERKNPKTVLYGYEEKYIGENKKREIIYWNSDLMDYERQHRDFPFPQCRVVVKQCTFSTHKNINGKMCLRYIFYYYLYNCFKTVALFIIKFWKVSYVNLTCLITMVAYAYLMYAWTRKKYSHLIIWMQFLKWSRYLYCQGLLQYNKLFELKMTRFS